MVTLLNTYLIRIVCVRTVNMPTESQIRNMTLSQWPRTLSLWAGSRGMGVGGPFVCELEVGGC